MLGPRPTINTLDITYKDSPQGIFNIVLRSLSSIDNRLIDHGERVAFILHEMMAADTSNLKIHKEKLIILGALHDIGAYKTEEIDNMTAFETDDVQNHAVYGYLFLNNFSQFKDYAEAILHHHTDYSRLLEIPCKCKDYAQLIFLADRIDILAHSNIDIITITEYAGSKFNPSFIDLFIKAEKERNITARLLNGDYKTTMKPIIESLNFTAEETLDFLNLLVLAMDFRSAYTVSHTANTTSISMQLGNFLNLSQRDLQTLYYGAVFHDLGKIAIPVEILEKNSGFTPEEFTIMKTHVDKTEKIIRGVIKDEICEIAIRHHEKLNGTGYPRGLTGADLTQRQRIVAIADILSALSGKRSYKEKFTKEKTLDILTNMKARGEICTQVCDVVFANYDEIMAKTKAVEKKTTKLYTDIEAEYVEAMATRF